MGKDLDLDDVVFDHPFAFRELRDLRHVVAAAREMKNAHEMLGMAFEPPGWALKCLYAALNDLDGSE